MKRLTLTILLTFCTTAMTTPAYVMAGNVCVQDNFRAQCPLTLDPNFAEFAILGPVPHDPNSWHIPTGKFNRRIYTCQDQGNPVDVSLVDTNCDGSEIVRDPNAGYILSAECLPGLRWWLIRATSIPMYGPSSQRDVLIVAHVEFPPNTPPTIAKLHHLFQKKFMMTCKRLDWDGPDRKALPAQAWIAARLNEMHY